MATQPPVPQVDSNELDNALDQINNTGSKTMQWVIIALLILIFLVGGIFLFSRNDDSTNDSDTDNDASVEDMDEDTDSNTDNDVDTTNAPSPTKSNSVTDTPTVSPTSTGTSSVPAGWEQIENETYGYTAYRPSNYYYRFFGHATLGIDQNAIPQVGDYAGEVTLNVESGSLNTVKNNWISDWLAIAESTETQDNGTWDLVSGTIPASVQFGEQEVIAAFYEKDGFTYIVDYRRDSASFDTNIFDQFYPAILFWE